MISDDANQMTRHSPPWQFLSMMPGQIWPAVPDATGANMLACLFQLERSQWLAPERLRELQFRQLNALLKHAYRSVPYYREHWGDAYVEGEAITPARFERLPLLTRGALQSGFESLKSNAVPAAHGAITSGKTSGSTGVPVNTLKTRLTEFWWCVHTVRDHEWHRRDPSGKLAAIRMKVEGGEAPGWGLATDRVITTGPAAMLPIRTDVATQLEWLSRQDADYLLSYPSNIAELARLSLSKGVRLPRLREVRAMGEALGDDLRELCREAWGVGVSDTYSSDEVGYIAIQCPENEHYHVQAETLLLEVLDADGKACGPGETGRVVVTALHNFALPLIRYELGDYAEVSAPCSCGRGLPVLKRILGRVRNTLVLADGSCYWPSFGNHKFRALAPVLQHQFVQTGFDTIEARLVTSHPPTSDEESALTRFVQSKLPAPFTIKLVYCKEIPRSASGKFEDFMSEVARHAGATTAT